MAKPKVISKRQLKNPIDITKDRIIPIDCVRKLKHEWVENNSQNPSKPRKMLPNDVIDKCPGCDDGPIRWSNIRSKRKAGPTPALLTCNRQALGRCDYSGALNRSKRRTEGLEGGSRASSKKTSKQHKRANVNKLGKQISSRANASSISVPRKRKTSKQISSTVANEQVRKRAALAVAKRKHSNRPTNLVTFEPPNIIGKNTFNIRHRSISNNIYSSMPSNNYTRRLLVNNIKHPAGKFDYLSKQNNKK